MTIETRNRKQLPSPNDSKLSSRDIALRKIRLVSAYAGAIGIAFTGLFANLASSTATVSASPTTATSPGSSSTATQASVQSSSPAVIASPAISSGSSAVASASPHVVTGAS
ncbi:MAG: hypothetical protein WCJ28_05985 [Actinomycetota bacterium]